MNQQNSFNKKNHENIKKTFFLQSSTMWKYSQLFIIHSDKGKPQHRQPKITFGSVFGAYVSNKTPKAHKNLSFKACWLSESVLQLVLEQQGS